jgi:hypothetical protein
MSLGGGLSPGPPWLWPRPWGRLFSRLSRPVRLVFFADRGYHGHNSGRWKSPGSFFSEGLENMLVDLKPQVKQLGDRLDVLRGYL